MLALHSRLQWISWKTFTACGSGTPCRRYMQDPKGHPQLLTPRDRSRSTEMHVFENRNKAVATHMHFTDAANQRNQHPQPPLNILTRFNLQAVMCLSSLKLRRPGSTAAVLSSRPTPPRSRECSCDTCMEAMHIGKLYPSRPYCVAGMQGIRAAKGNTGTVVRNPQCRMVSWRAGPEALILIRVCIQCLACI